MPDSLPFIYWDSCVPLSYVNEIEDRVQHIAPLMKQSGQEIQIVTSVLSVTEVAFGKLEQDKKLLDKETESIIQNLWRVGGPVKLVEFYELIAVRARDIMRAAVAKGWSIKPADAIHIATADQLKAKEFHTYDKRLKKFSELTANKIPIGPPRAKAPHLPLRSNSVKAKADEPSKREPGDRKKKAKTPPEPSPAKKKGGRRTAKKPSGQQEARPSA